MELEISICLFTEKYGLVYLESRVLDLTPNNTDDPTF